MQPLASAAILRQGSPCQAHSAVFPPTSSAARHEPRPDKRCLFVEHQHAAFKKRLRSLAAGKRSLEKAHRVSCPSSLPGRHFQQAAPDFTDGERRNKQLFIRLLSHPRNNKGLRWNWLREVTDDVGIEQVPAHRLSRVRYRLCDRRYRPSVLILRSGARQIQRRTEQRPENVPFGRLFFGN